ncbi:secondary thiamine-phosphate synthase enzyme YjbQ [Kiritimatiella glycovorans]|uniref:Secondary thiamine-phosphate synthase enzyme n=1 Tax=Kiritimatiella glycovorans TaxID=1307763 RepID=A0A0G3EE29_9BACT|nr:secondary thiamine-phosphate synthase enzyme YjbQ [Kiritimatiella glycovorans]AKJ63672.1 secondary thiamine-phosphate synthase enzyme [Kiritimatiella glycovorans]
MAVFSKTIDLQSRDHMPHFHNVTDAVKDIVAESGIKNGICVVYSHHTTCSVMTQECSHDLNYFGREYLQVDLMEIMEKMIPTCRTEGQYHHPGPEHIEFALSHPDEEAKGSLNTDAHLRSCFFGRSETIVLNDGELSLGDFGFIYFIDWDQVRERGRVCEVQIIGE